MTDIDTAAAWAPPRPAPITRDALLASVGTAIATCDREVLTGDFPTHTIYRLAYHFALLNHLKGMQAADPTVRWGQRADGGWWFRAAGFRTDASVTLSLAVRKWISRMQPGARI